MRLVSGAILLLAAEQAFAHAHLIGFPNHDVAARVLVPASLVLLVLGSLMTVWGLLTEGLRRQPPPPPPPHEPLRP